jgi:NAD-dependent dihydropyrimidine dehydrogenase PreA subunit
VILYFTGTGNSKFVADALAARLDDETLSINDAMRRDSPLSLVSDTPYVIVTPIHTWRMPEEVEDFLKRGRYLGMPGGRAGRQAPGSQVAGDAGMPPAYFVATMAGDCGAAEERCRRLALVMGVRYRGFAAVRMPDNCVYLDTMPTPEQARETIRGAIPAIDDVAARVAAGEPLEWRRPGPSDRLKSGSAMHSFYRRFVVNGATFVAGDACVGCGLCERVCPVGNVTMQDGRPRFSDRCCACYACVNRCPTQAIEIRGHSERHGRYACPDYRAFVRGEGRA